MAKTIMDTGVEAISLADTVGAAGPELVQRVVTSVLSNCAGSEIGIHMHSTRTDAPAKVLAAFDAGCRRFDSAMGGLGGCPFAQDALVGNIPTKEVIRALADRGVDFSLRNPLGSITVLNQRISDEFS